MTMFSASELAILRDMSQSAMPDQGIIVRPAIGGSTHADTSIYTPNAPGTVYSGPLRVKDAIGQDTTVIFGDNLVTTVRYIGVIPHDAADINIDDIVKVTSSSDPLITGLSFRVRAVAAGSYLVDRRLALELVE